MTYEAKTERKRKIGRPTCVFGKFNCNFSVSHRTTTQKVNQQGYRGIEKRDQDQPEDLEQQQQSDNVLSIFFQVPMNDTFIKETKSWQLNKSQQI